MPFLSVRLLLGGSLLPIVLAASPVRADASYLDQFEAAWSGKGFIQREQDNEPRSIRCSVEGSKPAENALSIAGSCRAAIIVTREIGADIRYDSSSDTFSGTYTGSSRGPAQLSGGKLRGGTVTFRLTYPRAVYGDRDAVMTITNSGGGSFTLSVTDQVNGSVKTTTELTLTRS